MDYAAWKLLHQTTAALSLAGFVARGLGSFVQATWVRHRFTRIAPHFVDTLLLLSALAMAWLLRLTPGSAPWLAAKIAGLLLYIGLGLLALRPGRPLGLRIVAWLAALAVFGWIISVALSKQPLGLLAWPAGGLQLHTAPR
jgi:uncharacterized membrane protein SirB2